MAGSHQYTQMHEKVLPSLALHLRLLAWVRRCYRRVVRGWWAWEVASAAVSLIAVAALLTILLQTDQRQLQTYTIGTAELTLNTLVAAIATIMRSSLLLVVAGALNQGAWNWFAPRTSRAHLPGQPLKDLEILSEAAANSWNSVKLLYRTKGRYLVSIGAAIMVLSIAFDAFIQQVISIELRVQPAVLQDMNSTAKSILPSLHNKEPSIDDDLFNSTYAIPIEAALMSSVVTSPSQPGAMCPTDHCTWPITPTVSVCSECADAEVITSRGTMTNLSSQLWPKEWDQEPLGANSLGRCNYTTYSLPWSARLIASNSGKESLTMQTCSFNGTAIKSYESKWKLASRTIQPIRNVTMDNMKSVLVNTYSFGMPSSVFHSQSDGNESPLLAYNCSLYLCVRGYSATTFAGNTDQQPITTVVNDSTAEPFLIANSSMYEAGMLWHFKNFPPELNTNRTDSFSVPEDWRQELALGILNLLQGNATIESLVDPKGSTGSSISQPDALPQVLWDSSDSLANLTAKFENMAAALTSYIRRSNGELELDKRYMPTVWTQIQVVDVQWLWLIFPLVLELSGMLFLALTMRVTRHRPVLPWKSHKMPLLLAEIDPSIRVMAAGGLARRTGLDDRIGSIRVRLDFDGDYGIMFRKVR